MAQPAYIDRINPFNPIYKACNTGDSREKLNDLPLFPRYIDVELTNRCNFNCLMCPTGTGQHQRSTGFLEDRLFYKLLKETAPYKTPLRFIRWGEPTLHPQWLHFIEQAKTQGHICHINTNGLLLNGKQAAGLVDLSLDSIKFSFQGVDRESYREMRNIDFFDGLLRNVAGLFQIRGDRINPYIHISTSITYESKAQVETFRRRAGRIVDLVTVGRTNLEHIDPDLAKLPEKTINMLRRLKKKETLVKKHLECPEVFDKLSINWDGTVSACCRDYDNYMIVGDLKTQSLSEIWRSNKMNGYRELLADMRHDELELCRTCYDIYGWRTPGLQGV